MQDMEEITISVIMPVKHSHNYVYKSLASLLKQKKEFSEIIIVDDKADKNHIKNIKGFLKLHFKKDSFKILKNETKIKGPGIARNLGVNKAKSSYIAFLDDDDIWPNNYLALRKNFIKKNNSKFTASPYEYVNENLNTINIINSKKSLLKQGDFLLKNPIGNSTVIINKKLLLKAGGYSKLFKRNDYATWLRVSSLVNCNYCRNIKNVKILRRANSLTSNKFRLIGYHVLAFKEANFSIIVSILLTFLSIIFGIKRILGIFYRFTKT